MENNGSSFPIVIFDESKSELVFIENPKETPVGKSFRVVLTNASRQDYLLVNQVYKRITV